MLRFGLPPSKVHLDLVSSFVILLDPVLLHYIKFFESSVLSSVRQVSPFSVIPSLLINTMSWLCRLIVCSRLYESYSVNESQKSLNSFFFDQKTNSTLYLFNCKYIWSKISLRYFLSVSDFQSKIYYYSIISFAQLLRVQFISRVCTPVIRGLDWRRHILLCSYLFRLRLDTFIVLEVQRSLRARII